MGLRSDFTIRADSCHRRQSARGLRPEHRTGFHPPHSDTSIGAMMRALPWRATYFMDPRFKDFNVAHDYVTASTGQSFKGGETPFGAAICNSDPERLMLVRNEPHLTTMAGKPGSVVPPIRRRRERSPDLAQPGCVMVWSLRRPGITTSIP